MAWCGRLSLKYSWYWRRREPRCPSSSTSTWSIGDQRGRKLVNLLTQDHSEADKRGHHHIVMERYHWYRARGLGYVLDRVDY